nr:hypothetical protein [uncultured Devosia sp.]
MTATDTLAGQPAEAPRHPWPRFLLKPIARWRRHRRAAATWLEISRLDERLRYDLGLDFTDLATLRQRAHSADPADEIAQSNALLDLVLRRRR